MSPKPPPKYPIDPQLVNEGLSTGPLIYGTRGLNALFVQLKQAGKIPFPISKDSFLKQIFSHQLLTEHIMESPFETIHRYARPGTTRYHLALSIRKNSYLCHATALKLHGLWPIADNTEYINREQTPKPKVALPPTQEGINRAFGGNQRQTKNVFVGENGERYVLLNGKHSNSLGVEWQGNLQLTSLERCLVDAVVRPSYNGGVPTVIEAFRRSRQSTNPKRLISMLRQMDFTYPYEQSLGFYMQRAGYDASTYAELLPRVSSLEFFVEYAGKELRFDSQWRIHYPASIDTK
jgi:hypothetical protein